MVATAGKHRIGASVEVESQAERAEVATSVAHGKGGCGHPGQQFHFGHFRADGLEARFGSQEKGAREGPARAKGTTQATHVGRQEVRGIGAGILAALAKELAAARGIETRLQGQPAREKGRWSRHVQGPSNTRFGALDLRARGAHSTGPQR